MRGRRTPQMVIESFRVAWAQRQRQKSGIWDKELKRCSFIKNYLVSMLGFILRAMKVPWRISKQERNIIRLHFRKITHSVFLNEAAIGILGEIVLTVEIIPGVTGRLMAPQRCPCPHGQSLWICCIPLAKGTLQTGSRLRIFHWKVILDYPGWMGPV